MELTSQYGYVFRVTCKEEKNIRNLKKFTTLDTNKAGVRYYQHFIKVGVLKYVFLKNLVFRFVSNRLQELNSDYQDSKSAYEEQQDAVVKEIVAIASGYSEPLHVLGDLIAKLDVLVSFAQVSFYKLITFYFYHVFFTGCIILGCLYGFNHVVN